MARPRTQWRSARRHLTPVAEGGAMIVGAPAVTFRTAPLPPGVPLKLWEDCGCSYLPSGPQRLDPAWTQWTEDPPREAGREAGKQCLRYALSDLRNRSDGGLLGPNYYGLAHFHSGDARHDAPGYPDLTIWTPLPVDNEVWELKRMGQSPTLPQAHHMTSLEAAGFTVRTVRPCCLLAGDVDRWLARLSGKQPNLSQWAPEATPAELAAGRQRVARAKVERAAIVAAPRQPAGGPDQARRLSLVPDPPGTDVADTPAAARTGRAVAYSIPMPTESVGRKLVDELEGWLRDHGFPPASVPWPMRIVVGPRLVIAWVNTGEPGQPGKPRPRTWRANYVDRPFPEHVVRPLGGDATTTATMAAAMSLSLP